MKKRVLVTGANGFLGAHLTRELVRRGYAVRAFVRSRHHSPALAGLPVEYYEGDIRDADAVEQATLGCDAIIHAAALAQVNPARDPAIWAVNRDGTANVIRAAQRTGVERLVYVGTANVFGFGTLAQPGNETTPFVGQRYGSDYIDSKRAATLLVEEAVKQTQLPAVLVHPTFMLGSLDAKPTSGRLLLGLQRGRVIGYPAGGKNYVYVRDVAVATVNALTLGRIGESYILGFVNLSYRDAFQFMARLMGVAPPRWLIPPGLARLYGYGCDAWTSLTGRPAQLNSAMIAVANNGHYFSARKAIHELNMPQTPIQTAIDEALTWFSQNGYGPART